MWSDRRVQQQSQRVGDHRSAYQRDKARILHSAAFRRLQAKTQVLGVGMSDFYRTRLTHSLEASQIGQGIVAQLRNKFSELTETLALDEHLIEALCLAHDIGQRWEKAQQQDNGMRVIADYISGMTDGFAARMHQTLFSSNSGQIHEHWDA